MPCQAAEQVVHKYNDRVVSTSNFEFEAAELANPYLMFYRQCTEEPAARDHGTSRGPTIVPIPVGKRSTVPLTEQMHIRKKARMSETNKSIQHFNTKKGTWRDLVKMLQHPKEKKNAPL